MLWSGETKTHSKGVADELSATPSSCGTDHFGVTPFQARGDDQGLRYSL